MVAFLMAPANEEVTASLHDCVKHVKNIPVRRKGRRGGGGGKEREREGGKDGEREGEKEELKDERWNRGREGEGNGECGVREVNEASDMVGDRERQRYIGGRNFCHYFIKVKF